MKQRTLKSLLKNYILKEALKSKEESPALSSIDVQVDKLLAAYESEAKNLKKEGYDFRAMTRRFLFEAPEDEEEGGEAGGEDDLFGDDEEAPEDDAGEEDTGDEEGDEEAEEPKKLGIDDIDIVNFSASVSRLIDNYDQLLEVRDTLIRRAREFLKKNYSEDVVSNFLSVLRDEYDIEIGVSDVDKRFDINVPPADRAGPSPGGGG